MLGKFEGANSKVQLEGLERAFQLRQAKELLEKGVRLAGKNRSISADP